MEAIIDLKKLVLNGSATLANIKRYCFIDHHKKVYQVVTRVSVLYFRVIGILLGYQNKMFPPPIYFHPVIITAM